MTLHVVNDLGRNYAEAGALTAVFSLVVGATSPLWGKALDKWSLRRVVIPQLLVLAPAFIAMPFLDYEGLLVFAVVAGSFWIPWFTIVRAALLSSVSHDEERAALSLDSIGIELGYIVGPSLAVVAATYWSASWTIVTLAFLSFVAALWLLHLNLPLHSPQTELAVTESAGCAAAGTATGTATESAPSESIRIGKPGRWLNHLAAVALAAGLTANFIMAGADLSVVAVMRATQPEIMISVAITMWCLGSIVGGITYGMIRRPIPIWMLVGCLSISTILVALTTNLFLFLALLFIAGLFCPPTFTSVMEMLNTAVPEDRRGEAFGWYGTVSTIGGSIAPPIVGVVIDQLSPSIGFVGAGIGGLIVFGLVTVGLAATTKLIRSARRHRNSVAV